MLVRCEMGDPWAQTDAQAKEPKYSTGFPTKRGRAPDQTEAFKLLAACSDDDDKHEEANIETIEHEVNVRGCSANGDRTQRFSPPLHLAIGRGGFVSIVTKVLDLGADPNLADRFDSKRRPLHIACSAADAAIVALLLEVGARRGPLSLGLVFRARGRELTRWRASLPTTARSGPEPD